MSRRLLKRCLPDVRAIRDHWLLRRFARRFHNANLWHCNRRSVSRATSVELFVAFLPLPIQMVIVAIASILLRANLSVAMVTSFVTNPLTMTPLFHLTYRFGVWLVGSSGIDRPDEVIFHWFLEQIQQILVPLIVGSLLVGTALAFLVMIATNCAWRFYVIRKNRRRKKQQMSCNRAMFKTVLSLSTPVESDNKVTT